MAESESVIRVPDSQHGEVEFHGRRLVRSSGFVERGLTMGFNRRWHDLELYAKDDGGFLLAITYVTKYRDEEGHHLAVTCADADEVYRVLRQYELRSVDGLTGKGVSEKHAIQLLEKFRKQERDLLRVLDAR